MERFQYSDVREHQDSNESLTTRSADP